MQNHQIAVLFMSLALGCSEPSFVTSSQMARTDEARTDGTNQNADSSQADQDEKVTESATSSEDSIEAVAIPAGDGSKALSLSTVGDLVVNTGARSRRYSELLDFTVMPEGGRGNITLTATNAAGSPNIKVLGARIVWKPGTESNGSYQSEAGEHDVTLVATDEDGVQAETHVKVTVYPIAWDIFSEDVRDEPIEMRTRLEIRESLHPERAYINVPSISGAKLNSRNCRSVSGKSDLTLDEEPAVGNSNRTTVDGVNLHTSMLTMKLKREDQPLEKIALLTWVNLTPSPADTVSSKMADASAMKILVAYTRCLGDDEAGQDVEKCKVETAKAGADAFYYCSDYRAADLHSLYCDVSEKLGTKGDGC